MKLPPTADALLYALAEAEGSLDYHDRAVVTSGLTALRHRGLAVVTGRPPRVVLTAAGWDVAYSAICLCDGNKPDGQSLCVQHGKARP